MSRPILFSIKSDLGPYIIINICLKMGQVYEPVQTTVSAAKSMGHGKVLSPYTTDPERVKIYLLHMCQRLGERLCRHDLEAQWFFIGVRESHLRGWFGQKSSTHQPTVDTKTR